jgi:predicted amidohydrolase YtcJ
MGLWRGALISAIGLFPAPGGSPPPTPADLVLRGAAVYTVDGARSWAEAVAVTKGRIVFVGANASASPWIGRSTKVLDLSGKMLLPAFHDAHVHPL